MEHYKEINKELVQQLQSMRVQLNEYKAEIIHLRGQISQQYEENLCFKKKCFQKAVMQCKEFIKFVEPECELVKNLDEYGETAETQISTLPDTSSRRSSSRSAELRRSSGLINSRHSVTNVSPRRARLSDEANAMENITPTTPSIEPRYGVIIEEAEEEEEEEYSTETNNMPTSINSSTASETETDANDTNTLEPVTTTTPPTPTNETESVDVDVAETVDEEKESQETNTIETLQNTILSITDDEGDHQPKTKNVTTRKVLGDVTNTLKKTRDQNDNATTAQSRSRKSTTTTLKSMSLTDIESESPPQVRELRGNRFYVSNRSIVMHSESAGEEDFTHFAKGISSSTPNSTKNSRHEKFPESSTASPVQSCTRPSRSCRPKNLKEPSCSVKLRNETNESKTRKTKRH